MRLNLKRKVFIVSCLMVVAYVLSLLGLIVFESQILFRTQKIDGHYAREIANDNNRIEEVIIQANDGAILHGWLVMNSGAEKSPLVIYYGGNAEEVSHMIDRAHNFPGHSLLLMNYRGYGLSEGVPSERRLKSDAELIFNVFAAREDIDSKRISVMGRSLGTGIAAHVATTNDVKGAILVTPYDSLVNVAQRMVKIFPMSWFMRNRFDSAALAPQINVPMLALIADGDSVIPKTHALKLVEQWQGTVESVVIEGVDHNEIVSSSTFWDSIERFLKMLSTVPSP